MISCLESKLNGHVDGAKGWVVSVNIGASAMFHYDNFGRHIGNEISIDKLKNTLTLCSGDIVIFNGG